MNASLAAEEPPPAPLAISELGIIAGNGTYPFSLVQGARAAGVKRIVVAAFENETEPSLAGLVDEIEWMRVGQLGKLCRFFEKRGITKAIMAGQIAPSNLFQLRPDVKALIVLARLRERNAESIFSAIGDELAKAGVELLLATTYMDEHLARPGHIAGPKLSAREEDAVRFGYGIAKEISRLDIGQTVIVKNGTVLAVEGFEGTNEAILRGGKLGRKEAIMVKVSKPKQDLRFDVPVIGPKTLEIAAQAKLRVIALETGLTLVLDRETVQKQAAAHKITVVGI